MTGAPDAGTELPGRWRSGVSAGPCPGDGHGQHRQEALGWQRWLLQLAAVVDGEDEAGGPPLEQVLGLVCQVVAGARWGSVSRRAAGGGIRTVASSDPVADGVDALQYAVGQGPCVQVIAEWRVVVADRLDDDRRWPRLAAGVAARGPVRSAVCVPLPLGGIRGASLNLYSDRPAAFGCETVPLVRLAAAGAAVAFAGVGQRTEAEGLRQALRNSRRIGAAIGVLMARYGLTEQRAFEALVRSSQLSHRKVRDLAEETLFTGALPGQ